MRVAMTLTERFLSGFALAATIAKDPGGADAQPGLSHDVREPMTAVARELLALSKADRRARVRAWLARETARAALPSWTRTGTGQRRPDPRLIACLQRIAAQHTPPTQTARQARPDERTERAGKDQAWDA